MAFLRKKDGQGEQVEMKNLTTYNKPEFLSRELCIETGKLHLISGRQSSSKTSLLIALALSVATGKKLFGTFDINILGEVIHIDLEMSSNQTSMKYSRFGYGMDIAPGTKLSIWRETFQKKLDDGDSRDVVKKELVALLKGKKLAIFDSLVKMSKFSDTDPQIACVLHLLKEVAEETGCAICVIHHMGKDEDAGPRGRSDIMDACDVVLGIYYNQATGIRKVKLLKRRDGSDKKEPLSYMIEDVGEINPDYDVSPGVRLALLGEHMKKAEIQAADLRKTILEVFKANENAELLKGQLYEIVGGARNLFDNAIAELQDDKEIEVRMPNKRDIYLCLPLGTPEEELN